MRWHTRLARLGAKSSLAPCKNSSPRKFKPRLERLEDRTTPAALSPFNFASLGTFNPGALGVYTVDESGASPVIRDPSNAVIFTGVFSGGVAVFDFTNVTLINGITLTYAAQQPDPVAILTTGTMTINGTIDFSGQSALDFNAFFTGVPDTNFGGPGGGAGGVGTDNPGDPFGGVDNGQAGSGPGGGQPNQSANPPLAQDFDPVTGALWFGAGGAGGGGFGGKGADGATANNPNGPFLGQPETDPGGTGGAAYGNLFNQLQGGSGGGGSNLTVGGAGGGGLELGAVANLTIGGTIDIQGGNGAVGNTAATGGGSGGGLFLHAEFVTNNGTINASGGFGAFGGLGIFGDGGGGGGGRIAVIVAGTNSNFVNNGTINLSGGKSGGGDPGNPPNGIPPGNFGDGVPDPNQAGNGTLNVQNIPFPINVHQINGKFKFNFPVRFSFNPTTGLYSGFITITDQGAAVSGPLALVFPVLPPGVTVANGQISSGGSGNSIFGPSNEPPGLVFINTTSGVAPGTPLRIFVEFTNPFKINLPGFFSSYPLQLWTGPMS